MSIESQLVSFFASFEFDASPCRYDPNHVGVKFRLWGEQKEVYLLEFRWRVGLYSEGQSRESATLSRLRKGVTMKANHLLLGFSPTIVDDGFNVRNTKVVAIRDPRVKLAHHCIATTITGRKESTHRVSKIDLFYLYYIYFDEVVCNIPYSLAKYMVGMREKSLICGGMFLTRIAQYFRLLTNEMMGALSVEPSPYLQKEIVNLHRVCHRVTQWRMLLAHSIKGHEGGR
nr:zinc finger, CCHC-type [Tanacetum cinerariifolium]